MGLKIHLILYFAMKTAKMKQTNNSEFMGGMKMKCPFCDIEMIQGYLNCGLALWSTRKHKISLLPDSKEQYAFRLKQPMVSPNHVKSDYCSKCKRMIIDCTEYESNIE